MTDASAPRDPWQEEDDSAGLYRKAMRVIDAINLAEVALAIAGLDMPRREARLLAGHVLGAKPGALLDGGAEIDGLAFAALVARRKKREPLAFIIGRVGFWTLDLAVSRETLIPRADSECLVEAAMAALPDRSAVRRVLDLGTGTGCLLMAALSEFPAAFGVGVDVWPAASRLAAANARTNRLAARAAFVAGDWAACLAGGFDLILCNPPYVETAAIAGLMPEVGLYEPRRALEGGSRGLDEYTRLMQQVAGLLLADGVAVFELGQGQATAVTKLARRAGLAHLETRRDLGGVERALVLAKKAFGSRPVAG